MAAPVDAEMDQLVSSAVRLWPFSGGTAWIGVSDRKDKVLSCPSHSCQFVGIGANMRAVVARAPPMDACIRVNAPRTDVLCPYAIKCQDVIMCPP